MCATRRANATIAVSTPATTPIARLSVASVPITVTSMTSVSLIGMSFKVRGAMLCQSNVVTAITIITATNAAIGIEPTTSPTVTHNTSRNKPARTSRCGSVPDLP